VEPKAITDTEEQRRQQTFPQYSGTALQGRQCVSGKGAVTPSKVSVKPQGGLGFGGSETQ